MKWSWVARFSLLSISPLLFAQAQTRPSSNAPPPSCPLELQRFNPSGVTVRVKNISGKRIVGLVFNVALADATEHWKWLHWDFDQSRSLREFSWNKAIKQGDTKNLSWYRADLDFEHGGGGAFVLSSVLFEDGASWDAPVDSAPCKYVWYNNHKKFFLKPIQLSPRE